GKTIGAEEGVAGAGGATGAAAYFGSLPCNGAAFNGAPEPSADANTWSGLTVIDGEIPASGPFAEGRTTERTAICACAAWMGSDRRAGSAKNDLEKKPLDMTHLLLRFARTAKAMQHHIDTSPQDVDI
ncbi:MAG: hypothetical protein WCP68_05795, partial [Enhydrobacter sp.]